MIRTLIAGLLIAASATQGLAHSKSEKTTPANQATVRTVETIALWFDDPMRITAITLTGPEGDVAVARGTGMDPVTRFEATPTDALATGAYTVEWRGLSADGHPMQGSFGFAVAD